MTPTACRPIMNEALLAINTALSLKQAHACFEHSSDSDKTYCSRSAWEVDGLCRLHTLGIPSQRAEGGVTAYLNAKRLPRRRRCSVITGSPHHPPPSTSPPPHLAPRPRTTQWLWAVLVITSSQSGRRNRHEACQTILTEWS